MTESEKSLQDWVERIADRDMPVFGRTAQQLGVLVDDESRHRSNLIQVILHDAGLTARIIRLANSAFYNTGNRKMTTVSRAVLVLGVNGIRNICLSIAMIDSLLKGENKDAVAREMGKAFYAAVVSKQVAERLNDPQPEEVFVAALLYRLGELALRCFGSTEAEAIDAALERHEGDRAAAEMEVLHFKLADLTRELAKRWQLGELLEQSLLPDGQLPRRCQGIVVAQRLADEAEEGLENPKVKQLLRQLSDLTAVPMKGIEEAVRGATSIAASAAREYGAGAAVSKIPKVQKAPEAHAVHLKAPAADEPDKLAEVLEPDPLLQLKILRELSAVMLEQPDFNELLEIVLEGMYRGIGMDLAVFALLTIDRCRLKAKFALGADARRITERLDVEISASAPNIFYDVIEKQRSRWINADETSPAKIGKSILTFFGSTEFFLAPAVVSGKAIGLFYADRKATRRPLDAESYESFKHFATQGNMALDYLARKK